MESGIYMIMNTINNKCYVGSTKNFRKRKYEHFKDLRNNKHHSYHLQSSFNKYGQEFFSFIVLEKVEDLKLLIERELYWIKLKESIDHSKGYNIGIPKQDDNLYLRPSTILKLKESAYYQFHSNNPNITLEEFLNGKRSKDLREKFGPQNKKKVFCFNSKTGIKELEFPSITEATKYFRTSENYLSRVLNIDNKTCKNFIIVTEDNFDSTKIYKKAYKTQEYQPKGFREPFKGNPVETYNLETLESITTYDNLFDAAEKLSTSRKALQKVIYKERKSFKGIGVRLIKNP